MYYQGRGNRRDKGADDLPRVDIKALTDPQGYLASRELSAAVNVALTLGMPLLLTGEPGSGKSLLAYSLAWELKLGDPLEFVVKSDTQGRDLFYQFDTVGRFHASQTGQPQDGDNSQIDPRRFIYFNALGRAILQAQPRAELEPALGPAFAGLNAPEKPRRSVVLIDEIDKAPRDVPNDILAEIEGMRFRVPEIEGAPGVPEEGFRLGEDQQQYRPIVVITSNAEKSLPDAFLRRCVYYHVPFPPFGAVAEKGDSAAEPEAVTIEAIVASRLGERYRNRAEGLIDEALSLFKTLRGFPLERKPSLAELLNWLDYLLHLPGAGKDPALAVLGDEAVLSAMKTTLLKQRGDQDQAAKILDQWRASRRSA